jgi:hypothetical protein
LYKYSDSKYIQESQATAKSIFDLDMKEKLTVIVAIATYPIEKLAPT